MSKPPTSARTFLFSLIAAIIALSQSAAMAADTPSDDVAKSRSETVRLSKWSGGICVIVGAADAAQPLAFAKRGNVVVHCLHRDIAQRDAIRKAVRSRGKYGTVSASTFDGSHLPYTDNLVNFLIVNDISALNKPALSAAEMLRVLAPLGTVGVRVSSSPSTDRSKWAKLKADFLAAGAEDIFTIDTSRSVFLNARKAWPKDIDEWTHFLHGADGNPVARDSVVGPPRRYQWTSGPTWLRSHETDSSVSTLVTAQGRLFYITDEAPISLPGDHDLPDSWFLAARDAFNGAGLWKVPIKQWGWRQWKPSWFTTRPGDVPLDIRKRLVAVGDKVYVTLGYRAPVSQLDARTGKVLQTYAGTELTGEILHTNGTLVLTVLSGKAVKVKALDAKTGKCLWTSKKAYGGTTVDYIRWKAMRGGTKPAKLNPVGNLATDGKAVALIDGADVVCLDFKTGAERWRATFPQAKADLNAGRIQSGGKLWVGTMIVSDGAVIHATPSVLAAIDAKTGKVLWDRPKRYIGHLWYEWKDVFVIDHLVWTWTADLERSRLERSTARKQFSLYPRKLMGYDVRTGEVKREVDLGFIFKSHHHHRCYRNKATVRYILASRRGTEFVDLAGGSHTLHNWIRGTCHVGMMPANGLQYAPPHPCVCYIDEKLTGMNAMAPAGAKARPAPKAPRLTKGPAYAAIPQSEIRNPQSNDWPAFRHDAQRTGAAATRVPDDVKPLWRVKAGRRISPPIAVGDKLFVSLIDEHHVACLDANTGKKLWEFAAGARVDSPPTYHNSRLLFGSTDGSVYCISAADGRLAWRFRAAPQQRLIGVDGQLESAWPVHGSVLVRDGKAYLAAGRSSQVDGGITVFALDAATGKVLHTRKLIGPDYATDAAGSLVVTQGKNSRPGKAQAEYKENYALPMGVMAGIMQADKAGITMRSITFDAELNRIKADPKLKPKGGFLDANYFKRTPWTFGGQYARLIVHDSRSVYYVRMFDSLQGLNPSVYFTPAAKGYLLFARAANGKANRWSGRVPVRIRAMVLTQDRLLVAGPPDVMDPADPLGAFEGRKGGLLYVIDSATGEKLAEHKLPSPPVFNGAAAARSRLFITSEDGYVTCFAK